MFTQDCVLGYIQPVPSGLMQTFSAACKAQIFVGLLWPD